MQPRWSHSKHAHGEHNAQLVALAYCEPCNRFFVLRGHAVEDSQHDDAQDASLRQHEIWNEAVGAGEEEPLQVQSRHFEPYAPAPDEKPLPASPRRPAS